MYTGSVSIDLGGGREGALCKSGPSLEVVGGEVVELVSISTDNRSWGRCSVVKNVREGVSVCDLDWMINAIYNIIIGIHVRAEKSVLRTYYSCMTLHYQQFCTLTSCTD
jgi:hypothetical protein